MLRGRFAQLLILCSVLILAASPVHAGDAVIFNGDFIKALKAQFNLYDAAYILTGSVDPSSVATTAPEGSLYLRNNGAGDGQVYIKKDSGSSTNWDMIATTSGTVLTPSRTVVTDASGYLAASATTSTEVGYLSGVTAPTGSGALVLATSPTLVTPTIGAATGTSLQLSGLTASRALQTDGSKNLESSSVTTTELGYVSGVTSAIQTQLNSKVDEVVSTDEAIARFNGIGGSIQNSGVTISDANAVAGASIDADANTITNIENADIKAGAAIARNKLASGTADHVLINDNSGVMSSEAALSPTRGGTGVSNAAGETITLVGDDAITFTTTAATGVTLPTSGTLLADPMTTRGDMIYRNSSNATARLPVGAANRVIVSDGTDASWGQISSTSFFAAGAAATSSAAGTVSYEALSLSESLDFTGALTSTMTVHFTRIGRIVTMTWPEQTWSSVSADSMNFAAGEIPAAYRPVTEMWFLPVVGNAADVQGRMVIGSNGSMTISVGISGGAFSSGITIRVRGGSVSYISS